MTGQVAVLVSFIVYLAFFGWLGWRRGTRRELIVLITATVSWLLLQELGDTVVSVANLGSSALAFAREGGLTGDAADAFAAISDAPAAVTNDSRATFLFIVWLAIFVFAYVFTHTAIRDELSFHNGWAILLGMLNGLFFAIAFLPGLAGLFMSDGTLPASGEEFRLLPLIGGSLQLIWDGLVGIWELIAPLGNLALLIILTLLLVIAASTIRGRPRGNPN